MFEQRILPTGRFPSRSRRPAGTGEQLQGDSPPLDSPSADPANSPSTSKGAYVLVVRRHVREDRIPCGRRSEAQRRGLLRNSGVTGSTSQTSNRLRRRPIAATAMVRRPASLVAFDSEGNSVGE